MDRHELARMIDHTLLKPEATNADVIALCAEAAELGTFSVCVSPTFVSLAAANVSNGVKVATVCGFPSGKHEAEIKAAEAKLSVSQGAHEIDMVIDRGAFLSGNYQKVFDEIVKVKDICGERVHLKVILETGELKTYDHVRFASDMAMEANRTWS